METAKKQTIEDREHYKEINRFIEHFENEIAKLPKEENVTEPSALKANLESLRSKSPEQLNEMIFELNRYSFYTQRLLNRREALKRWARSKLDELEAYFLPEIDAEFGWNGRAKIARHTPEQCRLLNDFIQKMDVCTSILYDIPNQVKLMADSIRDMKFVALKREKENHE